MMRNKVNLSRIVCWLAWTSVVALATSTALAQRPDPRATAAPSGTGWTQFRQQAGALVIHVAADGRDDAPGTEAKPKATIEAGYAAVRDGRADRVLLRRGDRFFLTKTLQWKKSGPVSDAEGWMQMGAYGDEAAPRPVIETSGHTAIVLSPGYRSDRVLHRVAFTDLHVLLPSQSRRPGTKADPGIMFGATEWRGTGIPIRSVLLENLVVQGFGFGVSMALDVEDVRIRRCIFRDIFNPGGEGTHASAVLTGAQGLLLEENVFYRIQHTDSPGVTGVSHWAHSSYLQAGARDVVCRGNIVIKATDGFMARPGGIYERNVSIDNAVAASIGQAYGVVPTAGGVEVVVHDNLFLDNLDGFHVGNAKSGVVADNLLLHTRKGGAAQNITLVGRNEQRDGFNIGVHGVSFQQNMLAGDFRYMNRETDEQHYSKLSFKNNRTGVDRVGKDIGDFLRAQGLTGESIDDYAAHLVARDRGNFDERLRAEAILDYFRKLVGLPALAAKSTKRR